VSDTPPVDPAFGDFTDDDAADTSPPDPEALLRILFDEVRRNAPDSAPRLEDFHPFLRAAWLYGAAALIRRLQREWRP
jgi:hypothetical protein